MHLLLAMLILLLCERGVLLLDLLASLLLLCRWILQMGLCILAALLLLRRWILHFLFRRLSPIVAAIVTTLGDLVQLIRRCLTSSSLKTVVALVSAVAVLPTALGPSMLMAASPGMSASRSSSTT